MFVVKFYYITKLNDVFTMFSQDYIILIFNYLYIKNI